MRAAFYAWLGACLRGRHWRAGVAAACLLAAALGQLPPLRHTYRQLRYGRELDYNFRVLRYQVAHPLQAYPAPPASHPAKMTFRLALPLLARGLRLGPGALLGLQVALAALMYWLLAAALACALADRVAGTLLALGLSGTYFGYAGTSELGGYFDAVCYALLVAAALARPTWLVFGLVLAGSFVDERMLLAAPLLVLGYGVAAHGWQGVPAGRYLLTRQAGAVYAASLAYAALRLWLAARYHLPTHLALVGISALRDNLAHGYLPLGYVFAFKSYLLLPLLAAARLLRLRRYGLLALVLACAAPIFLGCVFVTDITRSLAYGGPLVLLCARLPGPPLPRTARRGLALAVAAGALLLPSYQVLGQVLYRPSVWMAALRWLVG